MLGFMLASPHLAAEPRYERVTHGWVDAPDATGLAMTVRLAAPWAGVELVAEVTPSPAYTITRGADLLKLLTLV